MSAVVAAAIVSSVAPHTCTAAAIKSRASAEVDDDEAEDGDEDANEARVVVGPDISRLVGGDLIELITNNTNTQARRSPAAAAAAAAATATTAAASALCSCVQIKGSRRRHEGSYSGTAVCKKKFAAAADATVDRLGRVQ